MLRNYLKIIWRNIKRHKIFSFINLTGLSIGFTIFILISLYIRFELGFDSFHQNLDRISRVEQMLVHPGRIEYTPLCPAPLSKVLPEAYPEIEKITRLCGTFPFLLRTQDNRQIRAERTVLVDEHFLSIFSFKLLKGDPAAALKAPYSVVLSQALAEKLFGDTEPVGQIIHADNPQIIPPNAANKPNFMVTGVIENAPANSHLEYEMLMSESTLISLFGETVFDQWGDNWASFYVLTQPGQSVATLSEKMRYEFKKHQGEESKNELYLRPLDQIHLYANLNNEYAVICNIRTVYIFAAVALFILLIASINFINLTTARASDRAKEVGIRKVAGAHRSSLVRQYLGESTITALIAMFLAIILAEMLLPEFRQVVNPKLQTPSFFNTYFLIAALLLALIVGGISGIYPALILASFKPVRVLKGKSASSSGNITLRKVLVAFQFFLSVGLIICTIIFMQQVHFLLTKDKGFSSDQVLILPLNESKADDIAVFRTELLKNARILNVGVSDYLPYAATNWTRVSWEGAEPEEMISLNVNYIDEHLIPTYGMEIAKGRGFSKEFTADLGQAVIINETAARQIGWENPIGKRLLYNVDYRYNRVAEATVVGIVRDFHFKSLHHQITPFMFRLLPEGIGGWRISVKMVTQDIPQTLAFIEEKFATAFPNEIFNYHFADADFHRMYIEEEKAAKVIFYLGALAIFISCLGLYGLTSYSIKQRTKEIGIRKAIGASISWISWHLTVEFVSLFVIANLLAWPAAYLFVSHWLQNFPYRVEVAWWVFLVAGFAGLFIALTTVGFQVIKTATANPVKALRYE